jgi:hypothetical protein
MSGRLLSFARADELFGIVSPYLIGFFPGHWSGVPPAIVAPGSWSTLFYNGDARPTDEVQVARQGDRLLLRLVPALPIPHERVVLSLTLVHPSFPDGVRRLTVVAAGHEVRGFREGAGRLRGGEGRSLDDGSHVLSLPMSWLSPAENFLLIASFRTAAGTVSRTPGRLLRLRLPDAAGLLR